MVCYSAELFHPIVGFLAELFFQIALFLVAPSAFPNSNRAMGCDTFVLNILNDKIFQE